MHTPASGNDTPLKTIAIVQSNYIPWKGYFDLIRAVDEFIILDDVQYTRRDWRNRNQVKTPTGATWLTIPVDCKGKYEQAIRDVAISEPGWADAHWKTIRNFYARAAHFNAHRDWLQALYEGSSSRSLSEVNHRFITAICGTLGIPTRISWSTDYELTPGKTDRLLNLCLQAGATTYLSGPAAQAYLDVAAFAAAGIQVRFADYSGYPEYRQLYPPFRHDVSILDLLLNEGPHAIEYMKDL